MSCAEHNSKYAKQPTTLDARKLANLTIDERASELDEIPLSKEKRSPL
jgi:hypothetical protein